MNIELTPHSIPLQYNIVASVWDGASPLSFISYLNERILALSFA